MKVTTDTIIETMKKWVEDKQVISPHLWVDAAQKLNVLNSAETDILFDLQQNVAKLKFAKIEQGESVARAEAYIETTDEYKSLCRQKAKVENIEEFIRIAKLQARLKDNEWGNN